MTTGTQVPSAVIYMLMILSVYPVHAFGRTKMTPRVVDRLTLFNRYGEEWVAEGVKLNDKPDFGGYQRIELVTYSSRDLRKTRYQIKGLLGLKLIRAEVVVNLGFPGYAILLEYSWTDSPATPRDYFKTDEILRVEGNLVTRVWKYNTEEDLSQEGKYVSAHLDFLSTTPGGTRDIVVNRIQCSGRNLAGSKTTRLVYRYGQDGRFRLMQTESANVRNR